MSLPDALERAASALAQHADTVRDANGDPERLLETLSPSGSCEVLGWLLSNEVAAGEELALAWTESHHGAAPLQALDSRSLDKPGRKVLRKALHRLRSRGLEVKSVQPSAGVARLPEIDESIEAAVVSSVDPRGSRMTYLVMSHAAGGVRIYEGLLDETHGIVEFRVYDTGRSRARKFLRELAGRANAVMTTVEPAAVRALLVRAAERQRADRPAPRGFIEHRAQLGLDSAGETPGDQVANALGSDEPAAAEALDRLAGRVREGEIGPWPPVLDTLRRASETISEGKDGALIVSEATRQERRHQLLAEVAADVFDEPFARATADRLRETAFVLWRSEQERDARDCLAAAAAMKSDPAGNPVSLAFVDVWFRQLFEDSSDAEEPASDDESPLLVEP